MAAPPPGAARRGPRGALCGTRRSASGPGLDDKRISLLERADDRRARRRRRGARARRLPRRGARDCAEFVVDPDARRRRPPAADLEGRRGAAQRLPRGPRVPARGAADALRGDLRGALVRRRARDRRRDDRALRRPRARRLLHHLQRPRGADRAPQGRRRPPDPVRQLRRRVRAAAAGRAHRRAPLRGAAPSPSSASSAASPSQPPAGRRPPAAGDRLPHLAGARGRAGRPGRRRRRPRRARGRRPRARCARTSCSPAAPRAPSAPS